MSDIIAADTKSHLSLSKVAEVAKKDTVIFQSLTEPLLDNKIQLDANWPDMDSVITFIYYESHCSFSCFSYLDNL